MEKLITSNDKVRTDYTQVLNDKNQGLNKLSNLASAGQRQIFSDDSASVCSSKQAQLRKTNNFDGMDRSSTLDGQYKIMKIDRNTTINHGPAQQSATPKFIKPLNTNNHMIQTS